MPKKSDTVILGICGGIAAFKGATVASRLRQAGMHVHVLMTEAATQFITPLTFEAITRNKVITSQFPDKAAVSGEDFFPHLFPSTRCDAFCVLPATADMIGKLAHGYADDIICAAALPLPKTCRRYVCPSMNADMWANQTVADNVQSLRLQGWIQLGPDVGMLACGDEGFGRLVDPDEIVKRIVRDLGERTRFADKTLLICSGPTIEPIDPVRFISNHSSGRMGQALAETASAQGASVVFVTGPVAKDALPMGPNIEIVRVKTAEEMLGAAQNAFKNANAAIFVAAVADFRVAEKACKKTAKQDCMTLELLANPDVAATLGAVKESKVCIGFALETHDGVAHAKEKMCRKNLDAIVLNGTDSFAAGAGTFSLICGESDEDWGKISKVACARNLMDFLALKLS